ncbi:hypothetical protein A3219_19890 [Salmonella enterica]|nr:hypothetical protein A3219_19890 [Salmonella enterica]
MPAAVERDIVAIIRRDVWGSPYNPEVGGDAVWFSTETPLAPGALIKIAAPVIGWLRVNTVFVRQNAAADAVADLVGYLATDCNRR